MNQRLERLKELLLEDRASLTGGSVSALHVSVVEIDEIVTELELGTAVTDAQTQTLLSEVQKMAARNASLLKAVLEGTKAAKDKIEMIRRAASQLNTYTSDGIVENVTPSPAKVEKRA
jgi:hypothetical protein